MAKTLAEQLAQVQAAIEKIEDEVAQAWQQGGRAETRPDLEALYRRERELQTRLSRETGGGIRRRQAVPRG